MKNQIVLSGTSAHANATSELLNTSIHAIIREAIEQYKTDYPENTIKSAVVTTTVFKFPSVSLENCVVSVWLTTDELVIKDVGNLLFAGYIPLGIHGAPVVIGEGTASTRGFLWKENSYTNCFDRELDHNTRVMLEEHIDRSIHAAINK